MFKHGDDRCHDRLDMSAKQIVHGRAAALVRNMHKLDACGAIEQKAAHVLRSCRCQRFRN